MPVMVNRRHCEIFDCNVILLRTGHRPICRRKFLPYASFPVQGILRQDELAIALSTFEKYLPTAAKMDLLSVMHSHRGHYAPWAQHFKPHAQSGAVANDFYDNYTTHLHER